MGLFFRGLIGVVFVGICGGLPVGNVFNEKDFPDLRYLNESVDPCDDFYEFACGNYEKYNPLPKGKKIWDNFYILQEQIENTVVDILRAEKKPNDPSAVKKAKDIYRACVDFEKYDTYYNVRPINTEFTKLGGWPMLGSTNRKNFSWNEIGDMIAQYGLPLFINYQINQNLQNADEFMLNLKKDGLALPSFDAFTLFYENAPDTFDDLLRSERKEIPYVTFLSHVAKALCRADDRCDSDEATIKKDVNNVLAVMKSISNSPNYPKREFSFNKTIGNIKDLQDWTNSFAREYRTKINWLKFFKRSFKNSGAVVTKETKVYVTNMTSIANILELVENTDPVLLRNFAFARLATYMAPDSSSEMWKAFNELYRKQYGDKYPIYDVRADYCKRKVIDSQMAYALSHEYATYFFDTKKIKKAEKMVKNLSKSFKKILTEKDWIDKHGKKAAETKQKKMVELLGFPDFVYKAKKLDEYYDGLKVCSYDHFGNMQRLRAFGFGKTVGVVGNERDRYLWNQSPLRVNAFYTPQHNRIVFPGAIMNAPFFGGGNELLDYARIGSIIGHEITHGFDSNGMLLDSFGNFNPIFGKNVSSVFNEKANCFKEQYSKYYIEEIGKYVNGELTLRENIADNGGIRESFRTFQKVYKNQRTKKFSTEQLFFIAFATNQCRIYTKEALETMWVTDNHTPNMFRVRGIVSNTDGFSEAFRCPPGAKMNPVDKCVLW